MIKKFAIIGNPITHSLSPVLHNYWFEKYSIEANYSIINVKDNNLDNIIKKIRDKELSGLNITLPFKQKIVSNVDILVNDAKLTSSVNTIYLNDQKKLIGEKEEFYSSLEKALHNYMKSKLNVETTDLSKDVISKLLNEKKCETSSVESFISMLKKCEEARYSPISQENMGQHYEKAIETITIIDKQI